MSGQGCLCLESDQRFPFLSELCPSPLEPPFLWGSGWSQTDSRKPGPLELL